MMTLKEAAARVRAFADHRALENIRTDWGAPWREAMKICATELERQAEAARAPKAYLNAIIERADPKEMADWLVKLDAEVDAARAEEVPPQRPPNAWSPISKSGLLRGIRHGQPTAEDMAIAEADGDTIMYFYSFTVTTTSGAGPEPRREEK